MYIKGPWACAQPPIWYSNRNVGVWYYGYPATATMSVHEIEIHKKTVTEFLVNSTGSQGNRQMPDTW